MLSEFFELSFNHLTKFGFEYNKIEFKVEQIKSYRSKHHYRAIKIKVIVDDVTFVTVDIPELIDHFFILNGAKYIPSIYIVDLPISIKKNSISLYSLFNPVSIYVAKKYIVLGGGNIDMSRFFRFFYDEEEAKAILETFEAEYKLEDEAVILSSFSKIFNVAPNREVIRQRFDDLFLDDWTKELYTSIYDQPINSFKDILDITIRKYTYEDKPSFIDLHYKRLVFIELLLSPLFKSVSDAIKDITLKNKSVYKLSLEANSIIKNFVTKLTGNFLFSECNGFSGTSSLKASFKHPSTKTELPKSVSDIHPTFKGRICSTSISNKAPGVNIHLIANQNVNLRTGTFEFDPEEEKP